MARFEPFPGLRYRPDTAPDDVTAPPYDVIDGAERAELMARSPHNVVHLDLPVVDHEAADAEEGYGQAARLLGHWRRDGILVTDPEPSLSLYRMGWKDSRGRPRQLSGVVGALELAPYDVLAHERTTRRDRGDRLSLLRATHHNLSPIWCLSLARGLTALAEPSGPPLARCTDALGVHHRLWRIEAPAVVEAVSDLVSSAPLVIADGHHRFETALAYRDERRAAAGGAPGPYDLTLALVAEAGEASSSVGAIHRLLSGLPAGCDLRAALAGHFDVGDALGVDRAMDEALVEARAMGLVEPGAGHARLLHPRPEAFPADLPDLDASRLELALAALPPHGLGYEPDPTAVVAAVGGGGATAGFLLRPATMAQVTATAAGGQRLPPKTTYFAPKLRTGLVLRSLD